MSNAPSTTSRFLAGQFASHETQCIYSIALGTKLRSLREIVTPNHLAYAKKTNSDYYCFTEPGFGLPGGNDGRHQQLSGITYNKIIYAEALSHYKQILYLDLDVVITKRAPSIFDLYKSDPADIIAFNESFFNPAGVNDAIEQVVTHCGGSAWSPDYYFNTGVFLIKGKAAAELNTIDPCNLFTGMWSEQTYLNWYIHNKPLSWRELDRRYNTMIRASHPLSLDQAFFVHFAGLTSPHGVNGENSYTERDAMINSFIENNLEVIERIEQYG